LNYFRVNSTILNYFRYFRVNSTILNYFRVNSTILNYFRYFRANSNIFVYILLCSMFSNKFDYFQCSWVRIRGWKLAQMWHTPKCRELWVHSCGIKNFLGFDVKMIENRDCLSQKPNLRLRYMAYHVKALVEANA